LVIYGQPIDVLAFFHAGVTIDDRDCQNTGATNKVWEQLA
jgi:hypothetical protein